MYITFDPTCPRLGEISAVCGLMPSAGTQAGTRTCSSAACADSASWNRLAASLLSSCATNCVHTRMHVCLLRKLAHVNKIHADLHSGTRHNHMCVCVCTYICTYICMPLYVYMLVYLQVSMRLCYSFVFRLCAHASRQIVHARVSVCSCDSAIPCAFETHTHMLLSRNVHAYTNGAGSTMRGSGRIGTPTVA